MTFRTAALITVALLAGACTTSQDPRPAGVPAPGAPIYLRVKLPGSGPVRRTPLEQYVRGAVLPELTPAAVDAAIVSRLLDVQTIVARTFAVAHLGRHRRDGYDLCSTTHCQLYDPGRAAASRWAHAANESASRTAGTVLWFGASAASALFHADCGGHTSAAAEVWGGGAHPYLKAIPDDGPAAAAHTRWSYEVEARQLAAAVNDDPRTRVGRDLSAIRIVQRDQGGRAALVLLRGAREPLVRGEELRSVLTRRFGPRSIRSTRFEVRRSGSTFVFTGQGYGHGVGLCQAGARARIRAGARPEQVLATYYPGTQLRVLR